MDRPVSMVPVSTIRVGDVVLCSDGIERTVCKRNLKKGFCGYTIFGDSYKCNSELVAVVDYTGVKPKIG